MPLLFGMSAPATSLLDWHEGFQRREASGTRAADAFQLTRLLSHSPSYCRHLEGTGLAPAVAAASRAVRELYTFRTDVSARSAASRDF